MQSPHKVKRARRVATAVAVLLTLLGSGAWGGGFNFVALGDTAYNLDRDLRVYERLIGAINAADPEFSIHVGDTWGGLECSRKNHEWIHGWFAKFDHPVFYTPGDNEWTDCRDPEVLEAYHRYTQGKGSADDMRLLGGLQTLDQSFAGAGYGDTWGSLGLIREVFFAEPRSLGANTRALEQQTGTPENVRWTHEKVVFATVNVPGSGYGFTINNAEQAVKAVELNRANVEWLKESFAAAEATNAPAMVISLHASLFLDDSNGGDFSKRELRGWTDGAYYWVALAIRDLSAKFRKPVLLIHGDFHEFMVDRPFLKSNGEQELPGFANITRLQVFGAPELKAVRVSVEPDTPWVFGFTPLYAAPVTEAD